MEQGPRIRGAAVAGWGLFAFLIFAVLLDFAAAVQVFALVIEEFLAPVLLLLLLCVAAVLLTRLLRTSRPSRAARDGLAEEEAACKQRLSMLRSRAEQIEVTLRDLGDLTLAPAEATRAGWADGELRESLRDVRRAMARERAALFSLEATRWLAQIEPLTRSIETLSPRGVNDWIGRVIAIRAQGVEVLARLRMDLESVDTPSGRAAEALLGESLVELDTLRAELLARRAKLLGVAPTEEVNEAESDEALQRLRATLEHSRARREVRSWLGKE